MTNSEFKYITNGEAKTQIKMKLHERGVAEGWWDDYVRDRGQYKLDGVNPSHAWQDAGRKYAPDLFERGNHIYPKPQVGDKEMSQREIAEWLRDNIYNKDLHIFPCKGAKNMHTRYTKTPQDIEKFFDEILPKYKLTAAEVAQTSKRRKDDGQKIVDLIDRVTQDAKPAESII